MGGPIYLRCVYCLVRLRKSEREISGGLNAHLECAQKVLDAMRENPAFFGAVASSLGHAPYTPEAKRELWVALFGENTRG